MLTDIKGEEVSFDSVKAQIKGELIFSKAQEIKYVVLSEAMVKIKLSSLSLSQLLHLWGNLIISKQLLKVEFFFKL